MLEGQSGLKSFCVSSPRSGMQGCGINVRRRCETETKMILKITAKNLKNARYMDNRNCPVARALKDLGYVEVSVGGGGGRFVKNKVKFSFNFVKFSGALCYQIRRHIKTLKPFTVELEVVKL
jgi:hypothetical protein